jgi:hypothetical protein
VSRLSRIMNACAGIDRWQSRFIQPISTNIFDYSDNIKPLSVQTAQSQPLAQCRVRFAPIFASHVSRDTHDQAVIEHIVLPKGSTVLNGFRIVVVCRRVRRSPLVFWIRNKKRGEAIVRIRKQGTVIGAWSAHGPHIRTRRGRSQAVRDLNIIVRVS